MRYLRLAFVPLLLVACVDQTPVDPMQDGPAFNWMNNPDVGNLKVYRSTRYFGVCWTDPDTGLRACHATIPLGDPDCGLQSPIDPADWQRVLVDEDAERLVANIVGDVFITIWDTNAAGACFGHATVAEGMGRIHNVDNDKLGSMSVNTNTWGFMAVGDLLTPGGDPIGYNGHIRRAWSADKPGRVMSVQVNLH
jgi:hypothetical protein